MNSDMNNKELLVFSIGKKHEKLNIRVTKKKKNKKKYYQKKTNKTIHFLGQYI